LTFFRSTEEDNDSVSSGSSSQLDQESGCGFIETAPAKKKKKCDSAVDEACGLLRAVKNNLEKNDVFTIFGEFVANKVRDLNSSRLQSIVQHKIHTILFEAEMELHNVQIHNEQTQLTVHFDTEHSSATYAVTSTSTPQSSSSSVSGFQIMATKPSSAIRMSEFIALK
jgi:hypothetical protein